jgi:hypothetical protein
MDKGNYDLITTVGVLDLTRLQARTLRIDLRPQSLSERLTVVHTVANVDHALSLAIDISRFTVCLG